MHSSDSPRLSSKELKQALLLQSEEFERAYRWLDAHMPQSFHEEADLQLKILIARHLLSFSLQDRFSILHFKQMAVVLSLDAPDADLKTLKHYKLHAIRYYRAFVSKEPPPGERTGRLRIALLYLRDLPEERLSQGEKEELFALVQERDPHVRKGDLEELLHGLTPRFIRSMNKERLSLALEMFFRAKSRDQCQYEVRYNEEWKSKEAPSLQLVFAWRNVPKAGFLYRLAQIINAHHLALQRVVATYINPYSTESVLILSLGLHGLKGGAAWEEADIDDLLREIALMKYFEINDEIGATFVQTRLLTGNEGHLVRNMASFAHQVLVYADPNLYSHENVVEGLCRHPELAIELCKMFQAKFDPQKYDAARYERLRTELLKKIETLDTGQPMNDLRRKNIFKQALSFIDHTLKTNFYRNNKSAFSFRLNPAYLDQAPYARGEKFPELPYGIFFIRGMHFIGFNIRFRDLARGGVRTVIPERQEQFVSERGSIFSEAYNLAYTQQKKNKDIPEGGAKTAILLEPFEVFALEEEIYRREMEADGVDPKIQEEKLKIFHKEHKLTYLHTSQRSFIDSLVTLINCDNHGTLKAKAVIDYWQRPEYIYLGPDENMSNEMIVWIANFAVRYGYPPGRSFMSSKPGAGINHKEFGVTSYGVHVYLQEVLRFLGIDPKKSPFTVKISGGPDGDVAGNEILNLAKFHPETAKIVALTDGSGTIRDLKGLDLEEMKSLFERGLPIRHYPPEKLSDGSFLLDLKTRRGENAYAQETLCWRKEGGQVKQSWLSSHETNHLFRTNVHETPADIFIPAGGRPRTLNEVNYTTFLDPEGRPTARAIVEGANLYLTPAARRSLEKLGVLILKDSSCNKGGVICSSFEVLGSLCLSEEEFVEHKPEYVKEVLEIIRQTALNEAHLLLESHQKRGLPLTELSEKVSERINLYKDQLLTSLEEIELPTDPTHPLLQALLLYCPPLLRERYRERIFQIPDIHKKAIIACYLASRLVYKRGLEWSPSIIDVLPSIAKDGAIFPGKK